jgi:hypothetical protein
MAHDVFISFSSADRKLAEKICDDLDSRGIKCWISSRGIRGGQNYQGAIGNALLDAAVMVLVFSASADKSDEIIKELSIASKFKKHVIPVRIEDFSPEKGSKFIYGLADLQYIDLFNNWEKEIDHLAADINFMMAGHEHDGKDDQKTTIDSEEDDDEGASKGKRITYATWSEFAREQSAKDPLKKRFMPIAKNVHDLINSTLNENNMPFEVSYGDGTFSVSVPKDIAKSKKRTCARFGLLNFKKDRSYVESLYKEAVDPLPEGATYKNKNNPDLTQYLFLFESEAAVREVEESIRGAVLKSYRFLSKT